MDKKITAVLEYLKPHGYTVKVNISSVLNELFPYPKENNEAIFNHQRNALISFLNALRTNEFISFNAYDLNNITNYKDFDFIQDWFGKFNMDASIKLGGLIYIADEQRTTKETAVSESIITTNSSVQDTNKLVRDISKTQRNLAYVSAIAISISTVYLVATYYKSESPIQLVTYKLLQKQEILLDSMRKSQKGIDSSLRIMAKKTLPKKN